MRKNKKYTGEFKEKVVKEYLSGQHGGLKAVPKIYDVRNVSQLKKWVKKYREDPTSLHRENRGRKKLSSKTDKSREELLQEKIDYLTMENAILKKWVQLIKEKH
ncbi:helix-turn-helix domain-containing protein [Lactococcus garvieae]|uniref:helix-turn-helix domain-containing protein n=1 Tax=Lactococcus garvieae TaxID=1363 RepID=UPI00289175B8|nr:helix-turn-helix domain-containing protein [Lactococcus garvieae]MDT2741238.1 helix-turn-helix domain-containing protein [Lactococcus garvieae]